MYGIENPVAYILGTVVFAELLVVSETWMVHSVLLLP